MIVTNIVGGLGNQMFMYAAGRGLALRHGVPLKLDLCPFRRYALRRFELDRFALSYQEATADDLSVIADIGSIFREQDPFRFQPKLGELPPPLYIRGYFQSFRYLQGCEDVIRRDFTFRDPLGELDSRILEMATASPSVALHVRRGDYVSNPTTNAVHGVLSMDYYGAALRLLRERVGAFRVFVFSDDPYWAQTHLRFDGPTVFVSHNHGVNGFQDMRLMAGCHHHIIANSSFSWWGAWLSGAHDKIVCAPRRWMNRAIEIGDLVPPDWTLIDA